MHVLASPLAHLLLVSPLALAAGDDPFPAGDPARHGIDPQALELLAEEVERLVAADAVVGAELHVIAGRETVLHRAFGWADREEERPLETGSIFCVRSMTKAFVGTLIQMLVDEGRLDLDAPAADTLEAFDRPGTRAITIRHLLTHTSGLPLTALSRSLDDYGSLADVAADAAAAALSFPPGERFQYSDAGSDTLGAIAASIAKTQVEDFMAERIFAPLCMRDSIPVLDPTDARTRRVPSAYSGGPAAWTRHWSRDDDPLFPIFLTSQSLYCTTSDYARFLALWLDRGRAGDARLLSEEAVERALSPGRPFGVSPASQSNFRGLTATYGQQWMLWHRAESAEPMPVVFGHGGSDGTHAWAFPERDLIVLFFTQSRGALAGLELESALDALFLRGDVEGFRMERAERTKGSALDALEGLYWDEDVARAYYVVEREGDRLAVERPGRFRLMLVSDGSPRGFHPEGLSSPRFTFVGESAGVNGPAEAFLLASGSRTEREERHRPDPKLPSASELEAGVREAHGLDRLERLAELGPMRCEGTLELKGSGRTGPIVHVFDGARSRLEYELGGEPVVVVTDSERTWKSTGGSPFEELTGIGGEGERLSHPRVVFGGWSRAYGALEVLRAIDGEAGRVLLVRATPTEASGSTFLVEEQSLRVVGQDAFELIPGFGIVGVEIAYADFRDVEGMTFPFRTSARYASSLLGEFVVTWERCAADPEAAALLRTPPGED